MKKILFLLLFVIFNLTVFGQTSENPPVSADKGIEDIYLAKDDGGKVGDVTEKFLTTDIPIHCVVSLNPTTTAVVVKMNFIAVSVKGVKPELKVLSISYKTDGKQNRVNFTGKPETIWTAGSYRVDIFLDGSPAGNRAFEIQKSPDEIEKTTSPAVKKFVSPPKPRAPRRIARN